MAVLHSPRWTIAGVGKRRNDAVSSVRSCVPAAVIDHAWVLITRLLLCSDSSRAKALHQQLPGIEMLRCFSDNLLRCQSQSRRCVWRCARRRCWCPAESGCAHGRDALFPQRLGDNAEHGSSIEQIRAVGQDGSVRGRQRASAAHQIIKQDESRIVSLRKIKRAARSTSQNESGCGQRGVLASPPSMLWVFRG